MFDDEDQLFEESDLIFNIRAQQSMRPDQMDVIYESTRLRDVYNTRWWKHTLPAYFIHYNMGDKPLKAGS